MIRATEKEVQRIQELRERKQREVDLSKSKEDRNKLGQFATPQVLANELLQYAKNIVRSDNVTMLDPAFGTGSFHSAFIKSFGANAKTIGFEIDEKYYCAAQEVWKNHKELTLKKTDFTFELPNEYPKINLIICNPPYVRHQHLTKNAKERLKLLVQKASGQEISGLAGLHAYFLLICHKWLATSGLAIWLVPSEILEVNYGRNIRNYLVEKVGLERIHFFDQSDEQFSDAMVSSCVIIYRKQDASNTKNVEITLGSSFLNPDLSQKISIDELRQNGKWSKHLFKLKVEARRNLSLQLKDSRKLGDIFSIKRGIATGDNDFFVLTKEKATELEIPKRYLRNILPSSRHLKDKIVQLDEDGFLDTEKKLVLLDIDLPIEQIGKSYPKLYQYLLEGINQGVDKGYLASRRRPWYSQEKRTAPDYFVRYMNRESKKATSHHEIFIKNNSDAIASNSYLMLYTKPQGLFTNLPLQKDVWALLNKGLDKAMYRYGRTYGGGLVKFEPSELKEIPLAI